MFWNKNTKVLCCLVSNWANASPIQTIWQRMCLEARLGAPLLLGACKESVIVTWH